MTTKCEVIRCKQAAPRRLVEYTHKSGITSRAVVHYCPFHWLQYRRIFGRHGTLTVLSDRPVYHAHTTDKGA